MEVAFDSSTTSGDIGSSVRATGPADTIASRPRRALRATLSRLLVLVLLRIVRAASLEIDTSGSERTSARRGPRVVGAPNVPALLDVPRWAPRDVTPVNHYGPPAVSTSGGHYLPSRQSEERSHGPSRTLATILFTDVVNSTNLVRELGDHAWLDLLEQHYLMTARAVDAFHGQIINTTGDGVVAHFGTPIDAIKCAASVREATSGLGLTLRSAVHVGEIELRHTGIGGVAIHVAARILGHAEPGEILVSRTITDLVMGAGVCFRDRGKHELRGLRTTWELFAVA